MTLCPSTDTCTYPVHGRDRRAGPDDMLPCAMPAIASISVPKHDPWGYVEIARACADHLFEEERRVARCYSGSSMVMKLTDARAEVTA